MFIYEISRKDRRERKGKLFANGTDTVMNLIHVIPGGAKNDIKVERVLNPFY